MPKKFTIPEKPCTLGGKVITSGDGEGDTREELVKFGLSGIMLNAKEIDRVLGSGAHGRLFVQHKGEDIKPAFGDDVNELSLAHRYVDCVVTLSLDSDTVTLPAAKITKVVLQPQIGGMTWMGLEVEAPIKLADGYEEIGNHAGLKIAAHLQFGTKPVLDKRQKSLPLGEGKDTGDDDQDDAAEAKPRGRKGNGTGAHA
jgi:hypothetical protein